MNIHQTIDPQGQSPKELIAEQAADWLVCFRTHSFSQDDPYRDPARRDRAFFDWVGQSPTHLLLFMEMLEIERRFSRLDARALASIRESIENSDADSVRIAVSAGEQAPQPSANEPTFGISPTRRWLPLAVAAAGICAALGLAYMSKSRAEVFATPVGPPVEYSLSDGSTMKLNTDSRVEVTYSKSARAVKLLQGEAFFTVKHDYSRPFTLLLGDGWVRDLGTQFNARLRQGAASVSVVTGAVEMGPGALYSRDGETTLHAGEGARIIHNRVVEMSKQEVSDGTQWLQGLMVFNRLRLEDAVVEVNRYLSRKLVVQGRAAQDIPVSGKFKIDRAEQFVEYLKALPQLSVDEQGRQRVVRLKERS